MTEPEASIRFALYFIQKDLTKENVQVSIDGAHVKTLDTIHFPIKQFLKKQGLEKVGEELDKWQGEYKLQDYDAHIVISSKPGIGDVVVHKKDGLSIVAEVKKGKQGKSNSEYPLMREAIGQLMTGTTINDSTSPMVVVPFSKKSDELARKWSEYPQMKLVGIRFALVHEDGGVDFI